LQKGKNDKGKIRGNCLREVELTQLMKKGYWDKSRHE
jgi:hypothetical protein